MADCLFGFFFLFYLLMQFTDDSFIRICLVSNASANAKRPFRLSMLVFLARFDLKNCLSKENELIEIKVNFQRFISLLKRTTRMKMKRGCWRQRKCMCILWATNLCIRNKFAIYFSTISFEMKLYRAGVRLLDLFISVSHVVSHNRIFHKVY